MPNAAVCRQELSPVHFLERAGDVFRTRTAVVDAAQSYSWGELRTRARTLASALRAAGLQKGERVAFLAFNSEPLLLAHYAIPLAGGVLVTLNIRLTAAEIAYIVENSGAALIFYSTELAELLTLVPPHVRRVDLQRELDAFMLDGEPGPLTPWLDDERETISINYTSGTTGRPKGVVYTHRAAYLNAVSVALEAKLDRDSTYLWTLPMFHCNGWTFTWALAAVGARSICIPRLDPAVVWEKLGLGVTHLCGAPTVLVILANDPAARRLTEPVRVILGGAPPSPTLLSRMLALNFQIDHTYGLTETYGPFVSNVPTPEQEALPDAEQDAERARQGAATLVAGDLRVVTADMQDVPRDGATLGEVVMRGNIVTPGYFGDPASTELAFRGGWFHSGDLAVMHGDGRIELKDRSKDIIISGGENISTIEVEQALMSHTSVLECAVIAVPDEKWGEVPKAFVSLKSGHAADAAELIAHCRGRLAHFKAPKYVEFCALPKTSTGKVQKYVLREREWKDQGRRIH